MELLKRVRNAATIGKLRERARVDASPRGYADLCRALVVKGRFDRALAVARDGVRKFPRSLELADQLRLVWRQAGRATLQELEGSVRENPTVDALRALAEHYVDVEELDRAVECAERIRTQHPESVAGPLVAGRALWKRFVRDRVAGDGKRTFELLRRAIEIDPRSFEAWKLLTEICFYVGAVSQALEAVAKALELEPKDEDVVAMHAHLLAYPAQDASEDDLVRAVEESDSPWSGYRGEEARDRAPEPAGDGEVSRMLHQVSILAGVRRLALSRVGIDVVAREGHVFPERRLPPDDLVALGATFRRRIAASTKRLGIGAFQECEVVLREATVLAFGGMNSVMLVELAPGAKPASVTAACRDVMGRLDVASGGPDHA